MHHKTHHKFIGFSCDLDLQHFSEVLFPVTTPKLWVGDERESRVFITPITGSGGGSECCSFWQNIDLGFGPSGTISVGAVHG